ncbi:uncharacterized protein EI90DRAFT_3061696, partial [Cantharellus anzutake]|uniref:uncharacterized protein n=1 Tax=Cantharellus anzutake TaxID=1750568 RepID=UPI0019052246
LLRRAYPAHFKFVSAYQAVRSLSELPPLLAMFVVLLFFLAVCVRTALADTYCRDFWGNLYRCNDGLSTAARIVIGVSISVALILLLAGILYFRQRRARREVIVIQQPYNPYNTYPPPEFGTGSPKARGWNTGGGVSYPPPTHPPSPGGHQQYPPPPGPPPAITAN